MSRLGTLALAFVVFVLVWGACSACGFNAPTQVLNRTVIVTDEGPVALWYADGEMPSEDQRGAVRAEVEEGYRDGRTRWPFGLPGTDTFDVRVVPYLEGGASGLYYPRDQVIVCEAAGENGYCDALDDDLNHHFCHWGQQLGAWPVEYDCARYWEPQ